MNNQLAEKWDARTLMFGKIEHLLSLAENDDDVVIVVTEIPFWGVKWIVSPAAPEFENGEVLVEDFIRDGNVEYYFDPEVKNGNGELGIKRSRVQRSTLEKVKMSAICSYNRFLATTQQ